MSTEHYLSFLREGDYVSVLAWPNFLISKYSADRSLGGDDLLILAIYELVNSDFSEKDFESIQILYAFLNSFILPAEKAYAGTVIINAAMQYYVYSEHRVLEFYKNKTLRGLKEIEHWMNRDNLILNALINNVCLAEKTAILEEKLPGYTKLIEEIEREILFITHSQELCLEYINLLSNLSPDQKTIKTGIRLGVAQALYGYLGNQIMLTPAVKSEIAAYLNKIRAELEPGLLFTREEGYLKKLENKTVFQRLYDNSVYCLGFFTQSLIKTMFAFNTDEHEKPADKHSLPP